MKHKPERYYKNFTRTRIEGTEKQPYVLDNVGFYIMNNSDICAFYFKGDGTVENVATGEILNSDDLYKNNGKNCLYKQIDVYTLRRMLSEAKLKSLFSLKYIVISSHNHL